MTFAFQYETMRFMKQADDTSDASVIRYIAAMPEHLAQAVDDFWHARKLPSRSAAIRRLIERGLEAEKKGKGK